MQTPALDILEARKTAAIPALSVMPANPTVGEATFFRGVKPNRPAVGWSNERTPPQTPYIPGATTPEQHQAVLQHLQRTQGNPTHGTYSGGKAPHGSDDPGFNEAFRVGRDFGSTPASLWGNATPPPSMVPPQAPQQSWLGRMLGR
jgi:hypothetical protein